jgi:hypothetical protein
VLFLALAADKGGGLSVVAANQAVDVFYGLAAGALELFWSQLIAGLLPLVLYF